MKYLLTASIGILCVLICSFSFLEQNDELKKSMARGKELYITNCVSCHMPEGEGVPSVFPPLAQSDYMLKDKKRTVQVIVKGASGEMIVNGITYNGNMAGYPFSDEQLADILNYIHNSWGNNADKFTPEEVKSLRE